MHASPAVHTGQTVSAPISGDGSHHVTKVTVVENILGLGKRAH